MLTVDAWWIVMVEMVMVRMEINDFGRCHERAAGTPDFAPMLLNVTLIMRRGLK